MADPLKKVHSGDPLVIPAGTFNTFIDAARDFTRRQHDSPGTQAPQATYNADCDEENIPDLPPIGNILFSGFAERISKRAYDSFGPVPFARRALWYVKAKTYSPGWYGQAGEWAKQGGDAILEPDPSTRSPRWSRWDAQDVAANATSSESIPLGSLAAPDADLEPSQAPTLTDSRARGWQTDAAWVTYRWNVTGGFAFLP